MVNEAIEALKVGDKPKAFALLRRHLAANPKDASAWLWMSEAASEPAQQIDALQQVLRLAPEHSRAPMIQKRLQVLLQATTPQPTLASLPAATQENSELAQRASGGLLSRMRRESPAAPSLEEPERSTGQVADIEEWLRTDEDAPHPVSATPISEFRVHHPEAPAAREPEPVQRVVEEPPMPRHPREEMAAAAPLVAEPPMSKQLRAEMAAQTSPLPRPTPPQGEKLPAWVWGVMFLSTIVVFAFLFILWKQTTGS
ncbi:MAG: hypothetical protein H0T73_22450 [Ardenticatenales bacterium]|nr:hypothetical protein [Ardenticatenales bacterium]